ncbi:hypothetical protein ATY81_01420 [Rhizobium sp. R72]|uniref:iron chelate uptake ABC transporter family permease subunit n=1 Tax=unclassified Rhizobium TaxID=2613769 RepID=UPI000B692A84|nr:MULTISPECIES: iron chelate uptake ABC transporter family permease subunit [unclassified Rhizobium]OWW04672.1 hypothetical protein ATY81_01420 [Rhizobium sp. R72]OWW05729.1 hypothetical protein ATY80_01420 [Rhizobium sp. R711]
MQRSLAEQSNPCHRKSGIAWRAGLSAQTLLLAGVATSAFCFAVIGMVLAQGDMRNYILLTWISGSANRAGSLEACTAILALIVLKAPRYLMTRWFAILTLGMGLRLALVWRAVSDLA